MAVALALYGWTVVRSRVQHKTKRAFFVYKRDCPADAAHHAADLAPFTHTSKAKAVAAGKAGHFAYADYMHHVYISGGKDHDLNVKCREAVEKQYPHLTFDSEIVEGVSGVRFHTAIYDLDSPLMLELRDFCRRFMAQHQVAA